MRRLITMSVSIVFLIALGCNSVPVSTQRLALPEKDIAVVSSETKALTPEQQADKRQQLKARIRLLEILTQIEKDIKSKKRKADFFNFALKDDDKTTLAAAEILLVHIAKSKAEIEQEIKKLHEELN